MIIPLTYGDTARYECGNCSTEFEVCLEPKAADMTDKAREKLSDKKLSVTHCPFCGSSEVESV